MPNTFLLQIWRKNQQNADEEFWQRTLATRPVVLSQAFAAPIVVLKDKAYVGGKGIENSQGKIKEYYARVHNSKARFSAFSPHGLVIAGNLHEELIDRERMQSFELFRQGLRDVQVVTFDELFTKIESLLQSLQGN